MQDVASLLAVSDATRLLIALLLLRRVIIHHSAVLNPSL
jgi:hypothetical protein